jgi:hypothetical protein
MVNRKGSRLTRYRSLRAPTGILFCFIMLATESVAQQSFSFLRNAVSGRGAALGGENVSLHDRDVNFVFSNPSLNGDTLAGAASVNYQHMVADIGQAAVAYSHDFAKAGVLSFGIQHLNYGTITGYDETGLETGDFRASETAILVGRSHQIGNYRFGVTFKTVFSNLAGYHATALAFDLGGIFIHPRQELTIGMVIRNAGLVVADFTNDSGSKLPFDIQLGSTFKPEHMPVRFTITAYGLTEDLLANEQVQQEAVDLFENVFSHLNFGAEVLFHKNFSVLAGYNYLDHRSLRLDRGGAGAGISVGLSSTIKAIDIVISRSGYVGGKAMYGFTLSTNMNRYFKNR